MADDKRLVSGYEVLQSVKIDGTEFIVGENREAEQSYMVWRRSIDKPFGEESHMIPIYGVDYLKMMREFTRQINVGLDSLGTGRIYRGSPNVDAALTAKDCVSGGMEGDLRGKVAAVRSDALAPEHRTLSHQLMFVTGGTGCISNMGSNTVFGINIYSGTPEKWKRQDILGVAADERIPKWAAEKLTALREAAEKEKDTAPNMDKDRFWKIIDDARETAGSWQGMCEPLRTALSELSASEIMRWEQIFREYQELSYKDKLWGAASVILNGCSDDGFADFRGWLIAQGKDVFMSALADPDSLADVAAVQAFGREVIDSDHMTPLDGYQNDAGFEEILYAGITAYEESPGGGDFYADMDSYPLSDREKAEIANEIRYADDIGVEPAWFDWDMSAERKWAEQKLALPMLYNVFNPPQVPEAGTEIGRPDDLSSGRSLESVLEKIAQNKRQPSAERKPKIKNKDKGGPEL